LDEWQNEYVKIFDPKQSDEECRNQDFNPEFLEQKRKGNIDVGKEIGLCLGKRILTIDGESSFGEDESEPVIAEMHRRILFVFAATTALEKFLSNEFVLASAKNSMYEYLRENNKQFYTDISDTGAISFYMLCKRSLQDKKCYGKYFAQLCDRKEDYNFVKLGNTLYIFFFDVARDIIDSYEVI
jgi:hypothetical protein